MCWGHLPPFHRGLEALNRPLKYQALNDRRLQRALTQLERLQRQRKGDYVPPPLKVSVDGSFGGE